MIKISIIDGSNYFKGLLLLIRKDHKISHLEIDLMKRIGKSLGFEKEFCENAINEIIDNEYIDENPPLFSSKEIARRFIKDGLFIAFSDEHLHPDEDGWLREVVKKNDLDPDWYSSEREDIVKMDSLHTQMQVDELTVQYF